MSAIHRIDRQQIQDTPDDRNECGPFEKEAKQYGCKNGVFRVLWNKQEEYNRKKSEDETGERTGKCEKAFRNCSGKAVAATMVLGNCHAAETVKDNRARGTEDMPKDKGVSDFMNQNRKQNPGDTEEHFGEPNRHVIVNVANGAHRKKKSNQPKKGLNERWKTEKTE